MAGPTDSFSKVRGHTDLQTPTNKKPPACRKIKTKDVSTSESESLCHSDELTIVREHMNFTSGLLVDPKFKEIVNWKTLNRENVTIEDQYFEDPSLRNFVILSALKIQQLMGDLKEMQQLNESL